jgi:uncharacterized protein (TIGR02453 family)
MAKEAHFNPELFTFLKQLRKNNNREWFHTNKERYESVVRDPFLRFIADLSFRLDEISPHLEADPRPVGGSMFRIYRDVRFSKDQSPYKTHAGAHFPHIDADKNVHVPGFYLHLEPGGCFAAAGVWHPDSTTLKRIRAAIVERPTVWEAVRRSKLRIEGRTLARPPKGYDAQHPFIEDLKRQDFVSSIAFSDAQVCHPRFLSDFVAACKKMNPLMKFLTKALGLAW